MALWHLLGRALCWSPAAGLLRTVLVDRWSSRPLRSGRSYHPEGPGQETAVHLRVQGKATLSRLFRGVNSASELVAPTGFGSQASLFEIAFEGLALAK